MSNVHAPEAPVAADGRRLVHGVEFANLRSFRASGWLARRVGELFARADVRLDGERPWDIRVNNERLFRRLALDGVLGMRDAYVDGWWDCAAIDQLFDRALRADLPRHAGFDRHAWAAAIGGRFRNRQTLRRARANSDRHYDLGNDLFEAMLDRRRVYSCAYWRDAATLDQAQEAKLDLICRKIGLRAGQSVLDIGCGWGGFCRYAAERYGARAVGITLSVPQAEFARETCNGLPVEIRVQDYRDVRDRDFDHVVSVGMFEHVGARNHRAFMETARRCLRDGGLFLLHHIGGRTEYPNPRDSEALWIQRRIFPGGMIPSLKQVGAALDDLFVIEDLHNFGADYDRTLMAWFANFDRNWPRLAGRHGPRFYRTWRYYLLACAGCFRSRKYQLWQAVLSKQGVPGGYASVR